MRVIVIVIIIYDIIHVRTLKDALHADCSAPFADCVLPFAATLHHSPFAIHHRSLLLGRMNHPPPSHHHHGVLLCLCTAYVYILSVPLCLYAGGCCLVLCPFTHSRIHAFLHDQKHFRCTMLSWQSSHSCLVTCTCPNVGSDANILPPIHAACFRCELYPLSRPYSQCVSVPVCVFVAPSYNIASHSIAEVLRCERAHAHVHMCMLFVLLPAGLVSSAALCLPERVK